MSGTVISSLTLKKFRLDFIFVIPVISFETGTARHPSTPADVIAAAAEKAVIAIIAVATIRSFKRNKLLFFRIYIYL
jgi:hypothetical protein